MDGPAFDPTGAIRFDLRRGAASDASDRRLLVVPAAAIDALERTHPEAVASLGSEIGRGCGSNVAARLGGADKVRGAGLEAVLSQLAGELAIAGVGAVHIERWGRAMVCAVGGPSVANETFLSALLGSALGAAAGREVACAPIGREGGAHHFFVGSDRATERARALAIQGKTMPEIVAELQRGTS